MYRSHDMSAMTTVALVALAMSIHCKNVWSFLHQMQALVVATLHIQGSGPSSAGWLI
jgi:hypothetical protein